MITSKQKIRFVLKNKKRQVMLLSENMDSLTKDWALKRVNRTPANSTDIFGILKLSKIARTLTKYKALVAILFLLTSQLALYDFNLAEYTTTNHYGETYITK
jgi:hypothetical protein